MLKLAHDLRFALRQLRKSPGFAVTVVLTLALGIGATTAIFSLIEGILLRPLPFHDPDRLVLLGDHVGNSPGIGVTAREIATYTSAATAFSSIGAFARTTYELSGGAVPEVINGARFNAQVFSTLGVEPILGRVFTAQEEAARQPLAVISYALWLNRYHRDTGILGSPIVLDRKTYSIIGVMPRSFEFPLETGRLDQAQLWLPMSLAANELSEASTGFWGFNLIARLSPDVTLAQGAEDARRVALQAMRDFPANMAAIKIRGDVASLSENTVEDVRPILRTLFLAVSVVLLIACFNVAALLLVRAIRRKREYAVRLALGARSAAIVRESLAEGLLLSLAGGLLGLGFAAATIRIVLRALPESMPRIDSISMNATVAAFALALALLTGALSSLAPAFAALRTNLLESLKEGAKSGAGSSSHSWLRSALVVAEISIALILLTVSGAFLRSYQKMLAVDPGFRADHVLVAGYSLPAEQYSNNAAIANFNRTVLDRLAHQPGTIATGIANALPASGIFGMAAYTVEGTAVAAWKLKFAQFFTVDGDYFRAMRIPLLDGRYFTAADHADAPLVILVNESMAKHSWPGERAVGKRMHVGNPKKGLPWATVVGVVADTKMGSPDEPAADQWYSPAMQPAILLGPAAPYPTTYPDGGYIVLRSALPPEQMIQTVRSVVASIDPQLALHEVRPMTDAISNVEAPRRFNTQLITSFAIGALLLAVGGIYAVVAFSVSLRAQEIAIRMALGAQRAGIARLVLISSARLALLGCALGVAGSIAVSRLVRSFLFEVSPTDPAIYIASVGIMIAIALAASALPAQRAASADPVDALRST
jgi:predicted permease